MIMIIQFLSFTNKYFLTSSSFDLYSCFMDFIKVKAPAKINLFLEILGERDDGFTEIRTVMQSVSLYDELTVRKADSGLVLSADDPSVPLDSSNTVAKAWGALCSAVGRELGAKVEIHKRIPLQSGLGGGSSDAGAVILALRRLFNLKLTRNFLEIIGSAVGSDVPFFFGSGSSLVEGRGEKIKDINLPLDYAVLLVKPNYGMDTSLAYSIARKDLTFKSNKFKIASFDFISRIEEICMCGNSLEKAFYSIHPEAKDIPRRLAECGALYSALSGSGSAFFGIFSDIMEARSARKHFPDMWSSAVHPVQLGNLDLNYNGV